MKKSLVAIILMIQLFLLFIFQNVHALFKGFAALDLSNSGNITKIFDNIAKIKEIFLVLSLSMAVLAIITAFYLIFLFKKSKSGEGTEPLSPLQDYLMELKNSEKALKDIVQKQQDNVFEKEELNKCIVNNINAAIILLNTSGRINIFNSVAEELFNQSFAHAKNNTLDPVFKKYPEIQQAVREHQNGEWQGEIFSKDRVLSMDINPLSKIGTLIMIKDITEAKRREEIERINKNFIMLGEFTAFLSHEIRNSLGVIYGYTKTIKEDKAKINKVNREIEFLSAMIESFLSFSKPIKIERKETFDVVLLLKSIARETGVILKVNRENAQIENDQALFKSIFSNLMLNSKESGADHLSVDIQTDPRLEMLLTDNGRGLPEKNRDKIWYPFFTTKEKGTGMGLAIVKKIVTSLNGDIVLKNSSSRGSEFKIVFYR